MYLCTTSIIVIVKVVQNEKFEIVAKTFQGLEGVLAEEITAIGGSDVKTGCRMVSFTGDKALLYKANLACRTALRILKPILHFTASNPDEVYDILKQYDWEQWLSLETTFAIDSVVYSEEFRHSKFVTYRMKDAIVDFFQEKYGKRPSVRLNNADIQFNLHIYNRSCTLSLDSSGESLHKRGYRESQTEAPINEALAAGLIMLTGWRGESDFVDPMCGSGTFLIEAAMIAANMAPGMNRSFLSEDWNGLIPKKLWYEAMDEANDLVNTEVETDIQGYDIDGEIIRAARQNAERAGVDHLIHFQQRPVSSLSHPKKYGFLITNPPYGQRQEGKESLPALYREIGERFRHLDSWSEYLITSYEDAEKYIGRKADKNRKIYNGMMKTYFYQFLGPKPPRKKTGDGV